MNTAAFVLHRLLLLPPLLLLLVPGGLLPCALALLDCLANFTIVEYPYTYIISSCEPQGKQKYARMYVHPQRNLTVLLNMHGRSGKNFTTELVLEDDCFQGDWEWWALLMMVKCDDTPHGTSECKLEVRTSKCIKACNDKGSIGSLDSLDVWASGASKWRYYYHPNEELCRSVPWRTDAYEQAYPLCRWVTSPSPSVITPTKATPSPATAPPPPATATASATPTTTYTTLTSIDPVSPNQSAGIIGGVIAGVVVVAIIAMVVVRKRRAKPTTEGVAMLQQNTESPHAENVTSPNQVAYRQGPAHGTADRQVFANNLYETVDIHSSANSLYEPFENL